ARNAPLPESRRMRFRIGVHSGDIHEKADGTVYGDGINVAARVQALGEPGGIVLSETVAQLVRNKAALSLVDAGVHQVKNIAEPVHVYTLGAAGAADHVPDHQDIRFCSAPDGVSIAYAVAGDGPPLVKAANWLNHLEYDWTSPIWRHLLMELASGHQLVRYDARGNGLSDWEAENISFDAFVGDLETVVDACGLDRFPLLGVSQGCPVSIAYAVRHPEKVSRLVLYGGFARGRAKRGTRSDIEDAEAQMILMRNNWGKDNPAIRQLFTSMFIPEGTPEQIDWFNNLQRITTSAENAVRIRTAVNNIDVMPLLAEVKAPTLVLHCRDDGMVPFEEGRRMAAMIPDARIVALEGRNHLMLEHEPAWARFVEEVRAFLVEDGA
ncbi:MAG: alpha/beta fold hydrolase, partial [Alphaproteobacteria bacterium]|nr:alpha/beta fold hydrolase [Alphaproteobacteria bacterium]